MDTRQNGKVSAVLRAVEPAFVGFEVFEAHVPQAVEDLRRLDQRVGFGAFHEPVVEHLHQSLVEPDHGSTAERCVLHVSATEPDQLLGALPGLLPCDQVYIRHPISNSCNHKAATPHDHEVLRIEALLPDEPPDQGDELLAVMRLAAGSRDPNSTGECRCCL